MHVSIALLIEFTAPVWIVVYLRVIKRKHVPNQMWLALLLALGGLALIAQIWDGLTPVSYTHLTLPTIYSV